MTVTADVVEVGTCEFLGDLSPDPCVEVFWRREYPSPPSTARLMALPVQVVAVFLERILAPHLGYGRDGHGLCSCGEFLILCEVRQASKDLLLAA